MVPERLENLVQELQADCDVTSRLKKVFSLSTKELSRAKRLEFTKSVLTAVGELRSKHAHHAFLEAIASLRALAPFLKTKGQTFVHTIATVEKHTVNHASCLCFDEYGVYTEPFPSVEGLVKDCLKLVCEARASPARRPQRRAQSRDSKIGSSEAKENEDPLSSRSNMSLGDSTLNRLMFTGAAKDGIDVHLPRKDSATVALVVSGALSVRLALGVGAVILQELVSFAKDIVVPWIRYLGNFAKDSKRQYQQIYDSYMKRVRMILLHACRDESGDPAIVLRARAFALTLGPIKLNQYARDLLRCVHCLTRAKHPEAIHANDVDDVVESVYDEALNFVSSIDYTDSRWFSEDVSSWLDHVASVWSRKPSPKSIPNIFARRVSALKNTGGDRRMLEIFELQCSLMKKGVYAANSFTKYSQDGNECTYDETVSHVLEVELRALRISSLAKFSSSDLSCESHCRGAFAPEVHGLRQLRLLRVLEPVRKSVVAAVAKATTVPCGALLVLETYISALLDGLLTLNGAGGKPDGKDEDRFADILSRLHKLTCAALESARELLQHHFCGEDRASLSDTLRCVYILLELHARHSIASARALKNWALSFFQSLLQSAFKSAQSLAPDDRGAKLISVASVAEECERTWFLDKDDKYSEASHTELWEVARSCYVCLKDWHKSTNLSLKILLALFRTNSSGIRGNIDKKNWREARQSFVRDFCLAIEANETDEMWLKPGCSLDFLLAVVMEYCTWVKQQMPSSQPNRKSFDVLLNLQRVRAAILVWLQSSSKLCAQRKLHLFWILFVTRELPLASNIDVDALLGLLAESRAPECRNHSSADPFSGTDCKIGCSSAHLSLFRRLAHALMAMANGDLAAIEEELSEARTCLSNSEEVMQDSELMHLSSEMLLWVGSVLATEDFDKSSLMAYEMARSCRDSLSISSSPMPLLDFCRHLGSLGYCEENIVKPPFDSELCQGNGRFAIDDGATVGTRENRDTAASERSSSIGLENGAVGFLDTANKHLRSSLVSVMRSKAWKQSSVSPIRIQLSGVSLDVSVDIRLESGQALLYLMLVLVESLYRFARLLLAAESLADGCYYLERCAHVGAKFLPKGNFFLQSVSAMHLVTSSTMDADIQNQKQFLQLGQQYGREHETGRSLCSESTAMQAVGAVALEKFSNRFTCLLEKPIGTELLSFYDNCDALVQLIESGGEVHTNSHPSRANLRLSRGITYAFMQKDSLAINSIKSVVARLEDLPQASRPVALYFLARSVMLNAGGLSCLVEGGSESAQPMCRRTPKRITRSHARKLVSRKSSSCDFQDVEDLVRRARLQIVGPFPSPQLSRRVWNLTGMLAENSRDVVSALHRSIGCSFDIRWRSSVRGKAIRCSKTNVEEPERSFDDLRFAFADMTIRSAQIESTDVDVNTLIEGLKSIDGVVVGLSLDETRTTLMIWRISANGTAAKRIRIPSEGDISLPGVIDRISDVIIAMKKRSVKAGQVMTQSEKQDWWQHRYSLDMEVKNILSDVESGWFGDSRLLLIPTIFGDHLLPGDVSLGEEPTSKSLLNLSHAAFPELSDDSDYVDVESGASLDGVTVGQLVLVVDTVLERIPWESLPILRKMSISVTRAPSLAFLKHHLHCPMDEFDPNSLFYVVNPAGDLQRTEETFKDLLESQEWSGSFGKLSREEVSAQYSGERIYLFCGHGAGDQYLSPRRFAKHGQAPIALLMGCSSARPDNVNMGDCESNGPSVEYLVHGSRAVIGNLWDVSDKDIDRFTSSVLSLWLGVQKDEDESPNRLLNLAESVAVSRSACRLPYLVGAAAIVMGAPNIRARQRDASHVAL